MVSSTVMLTTIRKDLCSFRYVPGTILANFHILLYPILTQVDSTLILHFIMGEWRKKKINNLLQITQLIRDRNWDLNPSG